MKGKKQKGKAQRTISEAIPQVSNEIKSSEPTFQIMGNTGGDYIQTKLPNDFFESVLFGEMALEYDFSIEGLTKLMDLYSLGIQYFLENNPTQAKYFQDRMGYILTNKDTLSNLKKQQDKEEKEKKEKNNNNEKQNENKENKKEEKKAYPKSCKNLPKVTRQRAKTNFMFKAQTIKKEDIKKKVTFVLHDTNKIKEDKENLKSIIKEDLNQQNLQWKEKLKKKREDFNANFGFTRPRNRTTFITKKKTFQTPGPSTNRSIMTLNSPNTKSPSQDNFGFGLKGKSNMKESKTSEKKYMNIDQENSEIDDFEKNEGDIEFLKQLKERHKNDEDDKGDKEEKEEKDKEENKKEDDDSDSHSDSDSDSDEEDKKRKNSDEFLNKIDEVEEEKESLPLRQSARKGELNKKKDIENNDENKNEDNKDNKDDNKIEENKDNVKTEDNKDDNNNNANNQEVKEKENNENSFSTQTTEIKNEVPPFKKRTSIVDEKNLVRDIDLDDVIVEAVEKKMKRIEDLNKIKDPNNNNNNDKGNEEASEGQTDEISSISNTLGNPIQDLRLTLDDIPLKFQETYTEVEIKMNRYVKDLNNHFYKDTFEMFSLELKELYDKKYKKYVEVNNEYHASITENEYQLDNDNNLTEEQKLEIQNIIDSLKEEQKDQIDKITDEYNQMIDSKIRDFKQTFFKKDCGINLMEEQLKLDIYTMINEAYY